MAVTGPSGPIHILVVDDDDNHRRLAEILLQGEGYSVGLAGTASQAIDSIAEQRPALIVLDLTLPDVHGLRLIERLRRDAPEIPVLVVTGDTTPDARIATLRAAEYLNKPYDIDALVDVVARLVQNGNLDGRAE